MWVLIIDQVIAETVMEKQPNAKFNGGFRGLAELRNHNFEHPLGQSYGRVEYLNFDFCLKYWENSDEWSKYIFF